MGLLPPLFRGSGMKNSVLGFGGLVLFLSH